MYQSLYRKYRPKNFNEVVGQETIVKTLKNAISKNTLNHAYLFTGPRGTGKTSIAKILAQTINCENLKNYEPCNKCVSCTQINNKQTIDIIEIDAASNNGVDEIREIRNKVNLVPSVGKYKVYIIDEVHMLTTGAFNALLKTLEEPPSHIIFILATTEPHKIPVTILSRCQRFDFKKISSQKMQTRLNEIIKLEKLKTSQRVLEEISRLSDGCMRDALSILDQVIAYADEEITIDDIHEINGTIAQEQLKDLIKSITLKDYKKTFDLIDDYDNKGKNFIKLSEEIVHFMRNVLLYINIQSYFTDQEELKIYDEISKILDENTVIKYVKIFNENIFNMKKASSARTIFEMLIIEIMNTNNDKTEIEQSKQIEESDKQSNKIGQPKEIKKEQIKIAKKEEKIIDPFIQKLKQIRINNTLCNFNKKQLLDLKNKIDDVRVLIINPDYSEIASMVIDSEIRAVGEENIIFVCENTRNSDNFNEKCYEIDDMLTDYLNRNCKTIAVDKVEWEKIKKEFNSKTKTYKYMEEPKKEKNNIKDKTEIEEIFDEIVEYS